MTTELPALAASEFGDFFSALWTPQDGGEPPGAFDWQRDLVQQLARELVWPSLVDLPTGTGKTSLLEIALFLQALDAQRPPAERWMPRRVVLVVDRRVVVDQADDRGRRIAGRLAAATEDGGVVWRVASRLRHLSGVGDQEPPLVTSVLRGGIVRDESWARRPDIPALISSTVDQVGSRLLFRGYGISASMRPVHAGLLANDCLFLLDEVHLARPFAQTLAAIGALRARTPERDAPARPARWHVVELSATPTHTAESSPRAAPTRFPLGRLEPGSHPVLRRRLLAGKPARLEAVALPAHPGKADRLFVEACAGAAEELLGAVDVTALGVIVNRVSTARGVARELADRVGAPGSGDRRFDVVLLTGRMRPVDRDATLDEYRSRLEMGRDRSGELRPLVVVATQAVEAGADFDLDAIVTECASLDALRQRFGRVDRDGLRSAGDAELTSVILARGPSVVDDDPVYGGALARTWAWLNTVADRVREADGVARVDFGIRALPTPADEQLTQLVAPPIDAPILLPVHLDAWVQTNPAPAVQPDVARWLHGILGQEADVQVVWRDDLHGALLEVDCPDELAGAAVERVRARPPASTEAVSLPVAAVRRWLLRQEPAEIADVDGISVPGTSEGAAKTNLRVLRWAGSDTEATRPIAAAAIRPGDTLVVPSDYGGVHLRSWAPEAREPVDDVAGFASRLQGRLAVVRLRPDRWPQLADLDALLSVWEASSAAERDRMIRDVLEPLPGACALERDDLADVLAARFRLRDVRFLASAEPLPLSDGGPERHDDPVRDPASPFGPTAVLTAPVRSSDRRRPAVPIPLALAGEGDDMSFSGRSELTLLAHLSGVAEWTHRFARRLGVEPEVAADVRLAAELHDVGKADVRFQSWLCGGDRAGADMPLAKSAIPYYRDRRGRERARVESGYPRGARHELTSVAMVAGCDALLARAHDPELVLHLLASHHGYCRGFAPLAHDPAPVTVTYVHDALTLQASSAHGLERIDSGIAERFWRVVERYGWFRLAWLETILRLADHRCSEEESDGVGGP